MHRVDLVAYDGFQLLDATGPASVFELAAQFGAAYEVRLVSVGGGVVKASCGIEVVTAPIQGGAWGDTVLVPGSDHPSVALSDQVLLEGLVRCAAEGRRLASVCSGAFILAKAGLLNGRRAATHWMAVPQLQRQYPAVRVDGESIFVEDGGVWTSAGVTAGIDLALAMVGRDHGEALARRIARKLVVYHRRPGSQSQHSALLDMVTPDSRFGPLLAWAREHLAEPLPVERLAETAGLSLRQFSRAFTRAMGMAPAKAIERLRIEAARSAIEAGVTSLDRIARETGFGSPDRMRRAFIKVTGQSPSAFRGLNRAGEEGGGNGPVTTAR